MTTNAARSLGFPEAARALLVHLLHPASSRSRCRGPGRARRGLPEKGRSGGTPGVPRRPGGEGRPGPALTCSGASGAGRHQGAAETEPRGPEQQPPRPHCPGAPRARRGRGGAARGGWPAARRLEQHARSLEGGRAGRQSARLWAGRGGSARLAAPVGKGAPGARAGAGRASAGLGRAPPGGQCAPRRGRRPPAVPPPSPGQPGLGALAAFSRALGRPPRGGNPSEKSFPPLFDLGPRAVSRSPGENGLEPRTSGQGRAPGRRPRGPHQPVPPGARLRPSAAPHWETRELGHKC